MDNRTKGVIGTIAAVLLCGCPGLALCIFGGLTAAGVPVTSEWQGVSDTLPVSPTMAFALLCAGGIFLAIPVVVAFLTLRRKSAPPDISGPLPPAA